MTEPALETPVGNDTDLLLREAAQPAAPAPGLLPAAVVCLLIGLVAGVAGVILWPAATWSAFLANFLFWTGVAMGGVVLAAVIILAPARWGRVVLRLAAGLGTFLPVSLVALVLLWFGRRHLFPWLGHADRPAWLDIRWLFARDALVLAGMTALALLFLYNEMRRDVPATRGHGDPDEWARRQRTLSYLATALAIGFFPTGALLSIDLSMSLDPGFHSSLYPLTYLAGSFFAALCGTAVLAAVWERRDAYRPIFDSMYLLDLGNLIWAFGLFVLYLGWTEYLTVWMGNLPDEVAHHLGRWAHAPGRWLAGGAAAAVGISCLLLFSRGLKARAAALAAAGAIGALGILLQRFLDVLAPLRPAEGFGAIAIQAGVTLGYLGAAGLCYLWLMRRVSLFPVEDPLFVEALQVRGVTV